VVGGQKFTVLGIVGGLVNVGIGFNTAIAYAAGPPVVPALAGNAIAATKEWYLIRRNVKYSTQARNAVQVIFRPSASKSSKSSSGSLSTMFRLWR
jgi:hypothetical protein